MPNGNDSSTIPIDRRTVLRLAAASSLPVAGATGSTSAQSAIDCSGEHPCEPYVRCYTPSKDDPQTVSWRDSDSGTARFAPSGDTVPAGIDERDEYENGLHAVAVYRGRSDEGGDNCNPLWDLLVACKGTIDGKHAYSKLTVSANNGDTAAVKLPQGQVTARKWSATPAEDLEDVDPDPEDPRPVLQEYFRNQGGDLVDLTDYDDDQAVLDGLTIAASLIAAGSLGTAAGVTISVVGGLVGLLGSDEQQPEHDDKYTAHYPADADRDPISMFYLPNIELVPTGEAPTDGLREASVDVALTAVASADDEYEGVHSTTLDLQFYEDAQAANRVVVDAGDQQDAHVPVSSEPWSEDWDVYLPRGEDLYAIANLGYQMPINETKVPGGTGIPGTLRVDGKSLKYWTSIDESPELLGPAVGSDGEESAGSLWVEDDELRYVDASGTIRALSGEDARSVPGQPGSLWIEDGTLTFVDENQRKILVEPGTGPVNVEIDDVTVDPSSAEVGDAVDVTASYANAGGEGTESVRIAVGDRTALETEVAVPAGESDASTWTVAVEQADAGDSTVTVEFLGSGSSASTELSVQTLADGDVVIDEFEVAESLAVPGESVTLSATYRNTGEEVEVQISHSLGDRDGLLPGENTLDPGQTVSGSTELPLTEADLGEQTVTLDIQPGPTASDDLHVLIQKPSLSVDAISVENDAVSPGDSVDVTLSISNGRAEKTSDIARLWYGQELVFEEHVSLDVYGSEEFSVTIDTGIEDIGTNQLQAELARGDDAPTTEFEVQDPCGDVDADGLLVDSLSVPSDLRVGQSATATATVTYCGEGGGAAAPELFLDDRSVDSHYDGFDEYETTDVEFELTPAAGEWGEASLRVETNVDERIETADVAPAPFGVELGETSVRGDVLSVMTTVSNDGGGTDVQSLELRVDGQSVDDVQLELEAGETTDVELTDSVSVGEHDVTVSSRTDEATATVERTPPAVTATLGSIPDPVVRTTDDLDVPTTIENPGSSSRTVEVVASAGGGQATEKVEIDPGASVAPTVDVPVELSGAQELTVDLEAIVDDEVQATDSETVAVADGTDPCEEAGGTTETVDGQMVCDVNGDGDYRDVTGDGAVTNSDVTTFFSNQHTPAWNDRTELFDFDGDGDVGQSDVVDLFEYLVDG